MYYSKLRKGFTLLEIIVASVLFLGLGTLVVVTLLWGLDAYGQGNVQTLVNSDCRTALKAIHDEMGHAVQPQLQALQAPRLGSAILIPNPYGATVSDETTPDPRSDPSSGPTLLPNSVCAIDAVAFIEPGAVPTSGGSSSSDNIATFDPTNQNQYSVVVYYVGNTLKGNPNPGTQFQHISANASIGQIGLDTTGDLTLIMPKTGQQAVNNGNTLYRMVIPNGSQSGDVVPALVGTSAGQIAPSLSLPSGDNGWQLQSLTQLITQETTAPVVNSVITLGDNDAISFVVSHSNNPSSSTETTFDTNNFQVDVLVARRFDTHVGTQRFIQAHEKATVAIRATN